MPSAVIEQQIKQIEDAMRRAGVWEDKMPEWVRRYNGREIPDIWQWLQYVYLPMCREEKYVQRDHLAPMLVSTLGAQESPEFDQILQRVVELDNLLPVRVLSE